MDRQSLAMETSFVSAPSRQPPRRALTLISEELGKLHRWCWHNWIVVFLLWVVSASFSVWVLNAKEDRTMLTVFGDGVFGLPVGILLSLGQTSCSRRSLGQMCKQLRNRWKQVLMIAVFDGLEKNLTNNSLHTIGAALKTALHGLNLIFTFLCGAMVGTDSRAKACLFRCYCKDNVPIFAALILVAAGGVVTAFTPCLGVKDCKKADFSWNSAGVFLQIASGVFYGLKFTVIKQLYGTQNSHMGEDYQPPPKVYIAAAVNPVIGLISLLFAPFFGPKWSLISEWDEFLGLSALLALTFTVITVLELQLTELTSPTTVAILSLFKNVLFVILFLSLPVAGVKEEFTDSQQLGFAVSCFGALAYACLSRRSSGEDGSPGSQPSALQRRPSFCEEEY